MTYRCNLSLKSITYQGMANSEPFSTKQWWQQLGCLLHEHDFIFTLTLLYGKGSSEIFSHGIFRSFDSHLGHSFCYAFRFELFCVKIWFCYWSIAGAVLISELGHQIKATSMSFSDANEVKSIVDQIYII